MTALLIHQKVTLSTCTFLAKANVLENTSELCRGNYLAKSSVSVRFKQVLVDLTHHHFIQGLSFILSNFQFVTFVLKTVKSFEKGLQFLNHRFWRFKNIKIMSLSFMNECLSHFLTKETHMTQLFLCQFN